MKLRVNGREHEVPDIWADEPLAVVLREHFHLVGTKVGCGSGHCGCCVVHVDGVAERSCRVSARQMQHAEIVTLEGLTTPQRALHPVQQAWLDERVSQCGYCQGGQIMAVAAAWAATPRPDTATLLSLLDEHDCRCGTQRRARRAIERLARQHAVALQP